MVTLSNETLSTILNRKIVRTYTGWEIGRELIGKILHAANIYLEHWSFF